MPFMDDNDRVPDHLPRPRAETVIGQWRACDISFDDMLAELLHPRRGVEPVSEDRGQGDGAKSTAT